MVSCAGLIASLSSEYSGRPCTMDKHGSLFVNTFDQEQKNERVLPLNSMCSVKAC